MFSYCVDTTRRLVDGSLFSIDMPISMVVIVVSIYDLVMCEIGEVLTVIDLCYYVTSMNLHIAIAIYVYKRTTYIICMHLTQNQMFNVKNV